MPSPRPPEPGTTGWTYEEYCALPDDGRRYEIVKGVLYVAPRPIPAHQYAGGQLFRMVADYIEIHDLGRMFVAPLDVVFARDSVMQPDVLYISRARGGIVQRANIAGSPDLVVEVLSPSTASRDLHEKRELYQAYGVPHLWFLNPQARSVEAYECGKAVMTWSCATPETKCSHPPCSLGWRSPSPGWGCSRR